MQTFRCRIAASSLLASVALLAGCTPSLNWREVSLAPGNTVALLPCKPDHARRSVPLGGVPTTLDMVGCDAAGITFAVMRAEFAAGRAPDEMLRGWQQATLSNMRAAGKPLVSPFVPAGGLPLAHAQRVVAQGQRANGGALSAQAVWTARALPGGGTEVLHAVMYAERPQPTVADTFFSGLKWVP